MNYNNHIRILGAFTFISSLLLGISLINNTGTSSFFGGVLVISYTLLQLVVGLKSQTQDDDKREDF